jgi:hypothetical protein
MNSSYDATNKYVGFIVFIWSYWIYFASYNMNLPIGSNYLAFNAILSKCNIIYIPATIFKSFTPFLTDYNIFVRHCFYDWFNFIY